MDDPPKHVKKMKNDTKTTPPAINIGAGAGAFGMGGILLLGGALITATIVSAFAFKTSRQRRSPCDTTSSPNQSELMMKTNKDISVDSSPMDLHNPSDGATGKKETATKPVQNLTPEDNRNYGMNNDEQSDSEDGNDDQESTLTCVDFVFEREQLDNDYEKIALDHKQGSQISAISATSDDDNENDEQNDAMSVVSNGAVTLMEEYEAVEDVSEVDQVSVEMEESRDTMVEAARGQVSLGNDVAKDEEIPAGDVGEDEETISMNEEAVMEEAASVDQVKEDSIDETSGDQIVSELAMGEEAIDAACVHQIEAEDSPNLQLLEEEKEKDCHDEIILKNSEGDSTSGDQIVSELAMGEEAIDAAYVHQSDVEEAQLLEEEKETDSHDEIILEEDLSNKTGSANQSIREDILEMTREDILEMAYAQEINMEVYDDDDDETEVKGTAQEVEDQVITEDELVNKEEKDNEGEIPNVEFVKEARINDQTVIREDDSPTPLMTEEEKDEETAVKVQVETITEDEISRVQSIEEDVTAVQSMQEELTLEAKIEDNMKEDEGILSKEQNDGDRNKLTKEDKGIIRASGSSYGKGRKQTAAWNLKFGTLFTLAMIWCICHWYSELPFPELSLVASLLFVFVLTTVLHTWSNMSRDNTP